MEQTADIGLIGLAVMGQNLVLNMDSKGFIVCVYNRTIEKVQQFLNNEAKDTKIIGTNSLADLVSKLKTPRKVMLMVKAGQAVDDLIQQLKPLLARGDVIIDGGNSDHLDTTRRCNELAADGLLYVGAGVSGGEEGARNGPCLMPGGNKAAWPLIKDIFQAICAKADHQPCCDWVGEGGAGHFVKMVHNGIEYGEMQLICEAYDIMRRIGLQGNKMSATFEKWNSEELDSFLVEITADILKYKDSEGFLLERIRDVAGQKGTGKWTVMAALQYGVPTTVVGESVFSRCLSALKAERVKASEVLPLPDHAIEMHRYDEYLEDLKLAVYCSKLVSFAQGFMLMREAAKVNNWSLNYSSIALIWRNGCIIKCGLLNNISKAFEKNPDLENLMMDSFFLNEFRNGQDSWRKVVAKAAIWGIPIPALSTALSFFDGYRAALLPANLLQAQRDYFGAHTYELHGQEGKFVHTNWKGTGGNTCATTYQV